MRNTLPAILLMASAALPGSCADSTPDFALLGPREVKAAAGDPMVAGIEIRPSGKLWPMIGLSARVDPPLEAHLPSGVRGPNARVVLTAPADIPVGKYSVSITGRSQGVEHTIEFSAIVDEDLTRRKQHRADAIEALFRDDVATAPAPGQAAPASAFEPADGITYFADVELRKVHAVLVLDRSASMSSNCDYLRASATRFTRLFISGRDSLGVISYGAAVDRMLPLTEQFATEAPDRIAKLRCEGATNTGQALEAAQDELAQHSDPEAMNAVILFTDGVPNVLAADWPIRVPIAGCGGAVIRCNPGPKLCDEGAGGHLAGVLMPTYHRLEEAGLTEAEESIPESARNRSPGSCFGLDGPSNLAFIPDLDLGGVPLTGDHPVWRYQAGPYAGKMRSDSLDAIMSAIANQVENAAQRLRSGPPQPTYVYVIGFAHPTAGDALRSLSSLKHLANDPEGPGYNPQSTRGFATLTNDPTEFWPAFQRVRQEIVGHATLHQPVREK